MSFTMDLTTTDYKSNYNSIIEFLEKNNKNSNINFRDAAYSPFIQVITILYTYISVQSGVTIQELMLKTSEMDENIFKLAANYNYIPRLNTSGKATMKIAISNLTNLPASVIEGKELKIGFTSVNYNDNVSLINSEQKVDRFFVKLLYSQDESKFNGEMTVEEGLIKTREIEVDNEFDQIVYFSDFEEKNSIDTTFVKVYVKEDIVDGDYIEYKSIAEGNLTDDRNYFIEFDKDLGLIVKFNIDNVSRTLIPGEILKLVYHTSMGDAVNSEFGTVKWDNDSDGENNISMFKNLQITTADSILIYETDENGNVIFNDYDITISAELRDFVTGEEISAITNGLAPETTDSIKLLASVYRNALNRAVTNDDYEAILKHQFDFEFIKAWSGGDEPLDMNAILESEGPTFTKDDFKRLMATLSEEQFNSKNIYIKTIDSAALSQFDVYFDKGFVYVLLGYWNNFLNIDYDNIISFLDGFKFPGIGIKFVQPVYCNIKLTNLTLKTDFPNDFSITQLKTDIKNAVNEFIKKNGFFSKTYLYKFIESIEKIDYIIDLNIQYDLKCYNYHYRKLDSDENLVSESYWKVIRTHNEFTEFPSSFYYLNNGTRTDLPITIEDISGTTNGNVKSNGSVIGEANKKNGSMKFEYDDISDTIKDFIVEDVKFKFNTIFQRKEFLLGINSIDDILIQFN